MLSRHSGTESAVVARVRLLLAIVVVAVACALTLPALGLAVGGALTFVEFDQDGVGGVDGIATAFSPAVSPDGKHVYVVGLSDDSVATFARNATTGALTFVEFDKDGIGGVDGLDGAISVTVSPDGKHVYVAGANPDAAVATFARNATSGALTFVEVDKDGVGGVDGLDNVQSVMVSPDGKHLYAASNGDSAVATFSRDATTGALTFVEVDKDGAGGVDGLNSANSVTVAPDGKHVYVTGAGDDAVVTFERNVTSGGLTFLGFVKDGVGGADGIDFPSSVIVSPDGKHAYIAGFADGGTVATYARDATSGALTFVEFDQDGVSGVDGIGSASSVTISPDGQHVYVVGMGDNAVATFDRDATSGALTFLEFDMQGVNGVSGLTGANDATVSADGKNVYVTAQFHNAVATFSRELPGLLLTVTLSGAGSGTVTGTGIDCGPNGLDCFELLAPGTVIALTATPEPNATFATFAGGACTTSPCSVTVNADTSVDAKFDLKKRTLTVTTSGAGSGTVTGTGINCGPNNTGDCTEIVDDGTTIVLTGNADANSTFDTFAGAACTTSPCSVTLDADKSVDASFAPKRTLTVTTSGAGSGTVTGPGINCGPNNTGDCSELVDHRATVVLTASPAGTSAFGTFAGAGCTTSPCVVTLDADKSVDARFDLAKRTLTVTTSGQGSGTVTGAGIACGPNNLGDCSETVDHGTVIVLTAAAGGDSKFDSFAGAGCTTSPCSVTLNAAKTVDANFDRLGAPTATIIAPTSGALVATDSTTIATYSCTAPGSTVKSCTATVQPPTGPPVTLATGTKIPAAIAGTHTITVTATNATDLTNTATRTYVVIAPPTATITVPASGTILPVGSKTPMSYTCASAASTIKRCSAFVTRRGDAAYLSVVSDGNNLPASVADTYTLSLSAEDALGQRSTTKQTYVVAAPPTATIKTPANEAFVAPGAKTAAEYSCASAASTVATCAATVKPPTGESVSLASGGNVPSAQKGTHKMTVTATDVLGQSATSTSTYVVAVCLRGIAFGLVEIRTDGCITNEGTEQAPRFETASSVKVNGMTFSAPDRGKKFVAIPPTDGHPGGQIQLDPATIKVGDFTAFKGKVDWKLPAGKLGTEVPLATLRVPPSATLHGLPVSGSIAVRIGHERGRHYAKFPMEVGLPDGFKTGPGTGSHGVTADASLRVDHTGVQYDDMKLEVEDVWVGSLEFDSVCFSYIPSGKYDPVTPCDELNLGAGRFFSSCEGGTGSARWDGNASMALPTEEELQLELNGGLAGGRVTDLGGIVDFGGTLPLDDAGNVVINKIGVALCLYPPPFKVRGTVGLGILPVPGSSPVVGINGSLTYTEAYRRDPWSLAIEGRVNILGERIGSAGVVLRPTGQIEFNADLFLIWQHLNSGIAGSVKGSIDTKREKFSVEGSVEACILGKCAGAEAVVSSIGVAGCISLGSTTLTYIDPNTFRTVTETVSLKAGAGYKWGGSVEAFANSCDLDSYKASPRAFRASPRDGGPLAGALGYAAATSAPTPGALGFTVPAKTPALTVKVQGNGAPPSVVLHGPAGETISGSGFGESPGKWIRGENPDEATTVVLLINPSAGAWTVTQGPGPVAPSSIQTAGYSAPPRFKAAVASKGRYRKVLDVAYNAPIGASVSIVEEGRNVIGEIVPRLQGRACGGGAPTSFQGSVVRCAKVDFRPTDGPGGKRDVFAIVTSANGMPRARTKIASYVAAPWARPSRPRGLRVRRTRSRKGVIVSWRPSVPAVSQTISVALSSGAKFGVSTKRCSSLHIAGVPSSVAVDMAVAGVRTDMQTGPYARLRLASGKTKAGARGRLLRRSCQVSYNVAAR